MTKTVLITGASRGIGLALATEFAKEGYELFLNCYQSGEELQKQAEILRKEYGVKVTVLIGDVADCNFVCDMYARIGRLDVLVNNAGLSYVGLLADMTPEDWHRIIDVNLTACFYTCKLAAAQMTKRHTGDIINISSVWGNVGASMEVAYSASKAGLNGLTKALAKELAPSNVRVNAIACGAINTKMNGHLSHDEMSALISEIPADRLGTPEEVAKLATQLVHSPGYLTGQIITLDGAWT